MFDTSEMSPNSMRRSRILLGNLLVGGMVANTNLFNKIALSLLPLLQHLWPLFWPVCRSDATAGLLSGHLNNNVVFLEY